MQVDLVLLAPRAWMVCQESTEILGPLDHQVKMGQQEKLVFKDYQESRDPQVNLEFRVQLDHWDPRVMLGLLDHKDLQGVQEVWAPQVLQVFLD